jgi:hypothetical protein
LCYDNFTKFMRKSRILWFVQQADRHYYLFLPPPHLLMLRTKRKKSIV